MAKRYPFLLACLATVGLASPVLPQPVGPEFPVNTYTTGPQVYPKVASDPSGNFVVVWDDFGQEDGSGDGIFGQRYDNKGNRLGSEFRINSHTSGHQDRPSVASDANGNFVVVWHGKPGESQYDVHGQRYDADGNRVGNEMQISTPGMYFDLFPAVASNANGDFVVAWTHESLPSDVFARRYDRDGNALGDEFVVNSYRPGDQVHPAIASDAIGNFVVVWVDGAYFDGQDGSLSGVFGQRYDSHGNPLGDEFPVNTYTTGRQGSYTEGPSVASDSNGDFIVVWRSNDQDGSDHGIFGQRFDSGGSRIGNEFQINTYTTGAQDRPAVASDLAGNFVVVWESNGQDGSEFGIFGQRFDSAGTAVGSEFQVNSYTTHIQREAAVASDGAGNFVVAWEGQYQDGGGGGHGNNPSGIFGQRFSAGCEAALRVQGDVHAPGSSVVIQVHIAHRRPKTVTVPWELRLLDPSGQRVAWRTTEPHTFEPGDVVDRNVEFRLPDDLAPGTYTLELAISGMAGTKGATTTIQVVRAE